MPEPDVPLHEASRFFNRIEEAFQEALDASLDPRGPDSLYDLIGHLGLPRSATVVDVGCGKGAQAVDLANRFGFNVVGVDPVSRHELASRAAQAPTSDEAGTVMFAEGAVESIPVETSSVDLIWCREVLMFADLPAAAAEFRRVVRPGGHGLVYQVVTGPAMDDMEAEKFWSRLMANGVRSGDIDEALTGAGFVVNERVDFGGEWGERSEEREGVAGRRLLHAVRLLRQPQRYIEQYGEANYEIMLGDCLWHVYRMIGKLRGYACVFSAPN